MSLFKPRENVSLSPPTPPLPYAKAVILLNNCSSVIFLIIFLPMVRVNDSFEKIYFKEYTRKKVIRLIFSRNTLSESFVNLQFLNFLYIQIGLMVKIVMLYYL